MTLLATFVGVGKYDDPNVPDLPGAANDATALWALFSDSVTDLDARRLLDEEATGERVRQALDETLGAAGPGDTALFFFAGHGTPAHQFAPQDARFDAVADTTIPMDELAERLDASQAKVAIVVLDCCFSGGATARVLQGVPIPRGGMTTVATLRGQGRVIIAASRDDEEAHELGAHGLLTHALLRTFEESPDGLDVGALTDGVIKRVRAEARRFGWEQTPVVFNLVEGGLTFPPLHPGALFSEAFPDTTGVRVGSDIMELAAFGLAPELLAEWSGRFGGGLNGLQLEAVNEHRVLDGRSLLVVAPTSSGKTFVGEMAAAKAIADGRKAVFLLPFKALTNEKYEDFGALYGERLDLRVVRCTGDHHDDVDDFVRGKYDIALLTYEMFLNLSLSLPSLLSKIGLVVLDEAQFIAEPTRGIGVELLLTNLLAARERGVEPQLVALSAVIGDVNRFDEWLGYDTLLTRERPVPLIEGVLDRTGTFQYLDTDGEEGEEQLVLPYEIVQRGKNPSSQDVIVPLTRKLLGVGEKVVVFRNTRGSTVGCAIYLANELGLPPAADVVAELPEHDPSRSSEKLRRALFGGTAFHNSDLGREERVAVERTFRDPSGSIRALAATTTVAAGVNTPANTAIIVETFFYGDNGRQDFTVAEYKNMAGRAGRLGLAEKGRSVLIADNAFERRNLFDRYVLGEPEPIESSFNPDDFDTWIVRLLTQVEEIPRDQVARLLARTYGGYLGSLEDPSWHNEVGDRLETLLLRMEERDLIEVEEGHVRLSLLGRACGSSGLSFASAMRLVDLLQRVGEGLTAEGLMACIQVVPEVGGYTSVHKSAAKEALWQREVSHHYGPEFAGVLQRGAKDVPDYRARCKRAAILRAWIDGEPMSDIEERYSVTPFAGNVGPGDITGFASRTRLYLRAAHSIADVLLLGEGPDEGAVDILVQRLEVGLPEGALGLMNLPVTLTRGEYLALYSAGYSTIETVLSIPTEELELHVGRRRAERLRHTA
jgi:replicative superfamily II helicase